MKNLTAPFTTLVNTVIILLLCSQATAQQVQYRDPANPDKGYWQIATNHQTRSTVIRFFNGHKHQIYEEIIAGKYIKLTDRNIASINKTFDQIAGNTMVSTQVKSNPLTSPAFRKLVARQSKKKSTGKEVSTLSNINAATTIKVNAFQHYATARFELNFQNPDQERLIINIYDKNGQSLYHESSSKILYQRSFNLEGMEYGKYKLVVSTANRKYRYTKLIQIMPQNQVLPEKQPDSILVNSKELANHL